VKPSAVPALLQQRTLPDRSGDLFLPLMNTMLFAVIKAEQNHG